MKTPSPFIRELLHSTSAALLICLFLYAATSKLLDFDRFRGQLLNQAIPPEAAYPLAWILPVSEITAVALLLFRKTSPAGFLAATVLLAMFTGYIALVMLGFWQRVPCSCGGVLSHLGWRAHFWFNIFFLLAGITGLVTRPPARQAIR